MTSPQPQRHQVHAAPAAGQTEPTGIPLSDSVLKAAVNDVIRQTYFRDDSPTPVIGDAPPVAQPGIPPMDPRITQIGRLCLYAGCATVPPGLVASLFLWSSGHADPEALKWVAIAIGCAGVLVIAVGRAAKRIMSAAPPPQPEIHNHGPVYQDQRNVHTSTRGVWAKTNNQQ
ncbi:hypothetical protein [Streptomyces sp. NPDC002853]